MKHYDAIIVGCGFAGATIAERFASQKNMKVLIIDKRNHIGGNMYDYVDNNKILIHKYGPHLFHTNHKNVFEYLKTFGEWFPYNHKVLGYVDGKLVPIPFNLDSIDECFDAETSKILKKKLVDEYGMEKKVPILELRKNIDQNINKLAEYIYEKVFLYYTMKQWDKKPDEIDINVTNRVPVFISRDGHYFQDEFQYMPVGGYTSIFEKMLSNKNIDIKLGIDSDEIINIEDEKIFYNNERFNGVLIYTGMIEQLFKYKYGQLPYRSLDFKFKTINKNHYQPVGTVNYPTQNHPYTRITEFKYMTMTDFPTDKTTIVKEYPCPYSRNSKIGNTPYYPIENFESQEIYLKYLKDASKIENLYLLGRLAQYKYYNMDLIVLEALKLYDKISEELDGKS